MQYFPYFIGGSLHIMTGVSLNNFRRELKVDAYKMQCFWTHIRVPRENLGNKIHLIIIGGSLH